MKKTPLKPKSRSERARLTDKLDKRQLLVVRAIYGDTCQRCLKKVYGCNSQQSHVIAKGVGASRRRFDLMNLKLLCNPCHRWWHANPTEADRWFVKKWPHRDKYLDKYRGGKVAKITDAEMEQLYEDMAEKLAELQSESM